MSNSIKLNDYQLNQIVNYYKEYAEPTDNDSILFRAKSKDFSIIIYKNLTCLFQGKNAQEELNKWKANEEIQLDLFKDEIELGIQNNRNIGLYNELNEFYFDNLIFENVTYNFDAYDIESTSYIMASILGNRAIDCVFKNIPATSHKICVVPDTSGKTYVGWTLNTDVDTKDVYWMGKKVE